MLHVRVVAPADMTERLVDDIGLLVLAAGFLFAIAVTLLFSLCIQWAGRAPDPFLHGQRPVSDLINSPNV